MIEDLAELPMAEDLVPEQDEAPEAVPVPHLLAPYLDESAILLDIDGTLLDLMPTPREVWVAPGLGKTLTRLLMRTNAALALVSGRSVHDIDLLFASAQFPAVGGLGRPMWVEPASDTR